MLKYLICTKLAFALRKLMLKPAKLLISAPWNDVSLQSRYQLRHGTVVVLKKLEGLVHEFPYLLESGHTC